MLPDPRPLNHGNSRISLRHGRVGDIKASRFGPAGPSPLFSSETQAAPKRTSPTEPHDLGCPPPLYQHPGRARAVTSFALKPAVKTASRNDLRYGMWASRFGFGGGVQSGSLSASVVGSGCTGEKGTATMPARSGQAYVESLKKNAPCVYLGGRRIPDVTAEPIFQEPIRAIAEQYDMQLDPAYRDIMT